MHLGIFVMYNIGQYPLGVPQVGSMDLAGYDYSQAPVWVAHIRGWPAACVCVCVCVQRYLVRPKWAR